MSALNNSLLLGQEGGGGYAISRSLRFNSSDSAYLSRTPASAGNRKTWTWSAWIKRNKLGTVQQFLTCSTSGYSTFSILGFNSSDALVVYFQGGSNPNLQPAAVYRDCSAWMHVMISCDTTQATAANRGAVYINGSKVTAFIHETYPSQNADTDFNTAFAHDIGRQTTGNYYCDFILADVHWIDGQALDPTSFGEFDDNGIWQPKAYTGSYGTNGFHLDFADNSTTAALGTDSSGAGNTWTVNNLSVTAGAGNDSLVDVPTNGAQTDTGVGGEVRGNYFVANPLDNGGLALANGNLDLSTTSSSDLTARGTIGITSGKWYWEVTATNLVADPFNKISVVGIATANSVLPTYVGSNATSWGYVNHNGTKVTNASPSAYGNSWVTNDVIGIAFDADNGKLFFAKNNTWQGSGDPVAGTNAAFTGLTSGPYLPAFNLKNSGASVTINTGARPFAYTAPSGFKALCTANLPAPVVTKPSTVMDVKLYTGNGSTQTISGLNMSPDLVWGKERSGTASHVWMDVIRGTGVYLRSDLTNAESANANVITSFDSNGFTLGTSSALNGSTNSYAAWCWDAGSSTVTNTQGSITSQVRANASAGFSVATWSGSGSGSVSVGHGLGVAPQFFIVKDRSNARNWLVYHVGMGATRGMQLNLTTAQSGADAGYWNNTAPTSTVATIGTYGNESANYVGYFWTPVAGYSSMGSYTGDGSTSGFGPFIHCGFRPKFVLIKGSSVAHDWLMLDAVRNPYNLTTQVLYANSSTAEMTNNGVGSGGYESIDILSNGFQIKSNSARYNQSGATYIYFAVAESPFQYARAR